MRIAQFLGTMRPGHDGVVRFIYRMREGFQQTQDEYRFITAVLPDKPFPDQYGVSSVPFPLYPDYPVATVTKKGIKKLLGDWIPDLIHVHTPCPLGKAGMELGRSLRIPVIATYHTHFPSYLPYYRLTAFRKPIWSYVRFFYNHCSRIIVSSNAIRNELRSQGITTEMLLFYPGVDTSYFSPSQRCEVFREKIGARKKVVVSFVGRVVWEKNLMLLVKAWRLLKCQTEVKLLIVGDGPAKKKLQRLLPDAYFTGFLSEKDLPKAYASSDVFVFPSMTETFGSVTVEALASGVPAICAQGSAACDVVFPNKNGLLINPTDPVSLATAIEQMVNNPQRRLTMAEEANRFSKTLKWEETLKNYLSLYDSLRPLAETKS